MAQLLLSATDAAGGTSQLRFVRLGMGRKVTATGTVAVADLPSGTARLAFYTRGAYFSQTETERRPAKLLVIQARRLIDAELAFNEPFRARQRATAVPGEGRQNLALAAVSEADYALLVSQLPLARRPFACITPAECAMAALLGKLSREPVRLLWRRGSQMLGLLVRQGEILARHATRVEHDAGADESAFALRVLPLLGASAARFAPGDATDLLPTLALGEWGALPAGFDSAVGAGLRVQLQALFTGAPVDDVAHWPELYGLRFVADNFNFLGGDYLAEVQGVQLARPLVLAASLAALATGLWAAATVVQGLNLNQGLEQRRTTLATALQTLDSQRPKPEELERLKRRLGVQSALEGLRLDRFLAWVSANTPPGVIIRRLEVNRSATPAAAPLAAATAVAGLPATGSLGQDGAAARQGWAVAIEYEVPGSYAQAEQKSAAILAALGNRAKLLNSGLQIHNDEPSRLVIALVAQEAAFLE
ncbi:MAG: hypothetical protein K9K38_22530 [Rhodoferax sp.]|nr:hypothetical protein [Rhodoferax sp.]